MTATESFSFLYLANVLGAMSGTFLTAVVWIEVLGFHHTLWLAAAGNFTIAFISGCLGWEQQRRVPAPENAPAGTSRRPRFPAGAGRDDKMDFVFDRVRGDGDGGGVDAGVHAGAENAGVFVCHDCFHLSGRDVFGFVDVSPDLRANRQKPKEVLIPALAVMAFFRCW
jgi:hypothetical protein